MSAVSAIPAAIGLAIAVLLGHLLSMVAPEAPKPHRYQAIDGLRGYLAFAVFLHHASIWYFYLHGSPWEVPPSNLYTHLGQTGVALFFMITGLLFHSKILDSRGSRLDWTRLYVSRLLRLTPLYLVAVGAVLLFVLVLSIGAPAHESPARIAGEVARWLVFTMVGAPAIDGVQETGTTVAHVVWSLRYEWLFYGTLPLVGLAAGLRASNGLVTLAVASLVGLVALGGPPVHVASFLVGMVAAVASRIDAFTRLARSPAASLVALACLAAAVAFYPSPRAVRPFLLISGVFLVIACGNTLWATLTSPASRALGTLSYGIYLLHGLLLFALFTFVMPRAQARGLDATSHWVASLGLAPCLVLLSAAAHRWVEKPAVDATGRATAWWKAGVARRRIAAAGR